MSTDENRLHYVRPAAPGWHSDPAESIARGLRYLKLRYGYREGPMTYEATQKLAEREVRQAAAQVRIESAIEDLAALTDPVARMILDLHTGRSGYCEADHGSDGIEWPCENVGLIASHYGIDMTDADLYKPRETT